MQISVSDPVFQTYIFAVIFVIALAFSLRKRFHLGRLSLETTQELKGFAIIAILFAHIGYYLASDTRFLFPFSVLAGVSVDLFLFLSGFGLAASALAKPLTTAQFYQRRLKKIYLPLWITLALFFTLDFLVLGKSYGFFYMLRSMAGFFTQANIFTDVNSPLWYITLILFYYTVFPLVFSKKRSYFSAIGLYVLTLTIIALQPRWFISMLPLYQIHLMAFPLGIAAAAFLRKKNLGDIQQSYLQYPIMAVLVLGIGYFALNSGVGQEHWIAEAISIFTMFLILVLFIFKRFEVRLFSLFGMFSFEIYLLHWPILYRYDLFFKFLPASAAVALYLLFFLCVGWVLQTAIKKLRI